MFYICVLLCFYLQVRFEKVTFYSNDFASCVPYISPSKDRIVFFFLSLLLKFDLDLGKTTVLSLNGIYLGISHSWFSRVQNLYYYYSVFIRLQNWRKSVAFGLIKTNDSWMWGAISKSYISFSLKNKKIQMLHNFGNLEFFKDKKKKQEFKWF